jgi:putative Holliday junction resolvase
VKILALDYGSARTGVAVSDPTGTVARPVGVIEQAGSDEGLEQLAGLIRDEAVVQVVVGLPLTLKGEHGEQARATARFVEDLSERVDVPVETFDERFTSVLGGDDDAQAAAHLLSSFLEWSKSRRS